MEVITRQWEMGEYSGKRWCHRSRFGNDPRDFKCISSEMKLLMEKILNEKENES